MSKSNNHLTDEVAKNFSRRIVEQRKTIDQDPRAVDALLISETFAALVKRSFARQKLAQKSESFKLDDNQVYSVEFANEGGDITLTLKIVPLKEAKSMSVNVLEKTSGEENLVTTDVRLDDGKSIEESVKKLEQQLTSGVIDKLNIERNRGEEDPLRVDRGGHFPHPGFGGGMGPRFPGPGIGGPFGGPGYPGPNFPGPMGGDPFGGPFGRRDPFFPGPNIRIDPVYPPGLGIDPVPSPDHFRPPTGGDFPELGGANGNMMGPNHPYFRNRMDPDMNPRRGGPERGNFGLPEDSNSPGIPNIPGGVNRMNQNQLRGQSGPQEPVNFGRRVDGSSSNPSNSVNPTTFFQKPN